MLKRGILNAQLRSVMARLGHRDRYAIVDAGYNVPAGIETVDLAFLPNIPTILQVLDGILDEMAVEGVILASEIKEWAPEMDAAYAERWPAEAKVTYIPHSEFDEEMTAAAVSLAEEYGLKQSGGSDFHGQTKPDISLGIGKGNLFVPIDFYENLRACADYDK